MSTYALTPAARLDLAEIEHYICVHDSPRAAGNVMDALHAGMAKIACAPWIGHAHREAQSQALRFWRVHRWLIAYLPDTEPVQVIRVLHGSRDIAQLL